MNKVFYDGDASKIIGERVILELIQDKLIEVRGNKICVKAHQNKGNVRIKAYPYAHEIIYFYLCPENVWISRLSEKYMAIDDREDIPAKIYYDGDASIIENEQVILELIEEKKIKIIDNKVWFNMCFNKGTTRTPSPIRAIGTEYEDVMYKRAFEGSWIYKCEKGIMHIDYDLKMLELMLNSKESLDNRHIHGFKYKGDVDNDNRTS